MKPQMDDEEEKKKEPAIEGEELQVTENTIFTFHREREKVHIYAADPYKLKLFHVEIDLNIIIF